MTRGYLALENFDSMAYMNTSFRSWLYLTVFVTGAAVLIVEVAAVRVLSPYYGSSLYVFSSVLTVILGALSAGYYVGGRISDRLPRHEPLFTIIGASGVAILIMEWLAKYILPDGANLLTFIWGPLVFGLVLFFIPAFLLGIVSPYVIKLQSLHTPEDKIGGVVGATFFWGTLGSLTGSLLTGFVLIPFLGIHVSILGTGTTLLFFGLVVSILLSRNTNETEKLSFFVTIHRHRAYLFLFVIAAVMMFLFRTGTLESTKQVLYEADGLYSRIQVYELSLGPNSVRVMENDTNNSSATYMTSYDLLFGYTQFAEFYKELLPGSERFLLIGGGAYSMPRTLVRRDKDLLVDVVEIEPRLFTLAQEYFDLSDLSRIQNFAIDGRVFLNESTTTYDIIFADAFGTDLSIPSHLATREFFENAKAHLSDDGLFMMNYIGKIDTPNPSLTGSLYKTLTSVFPNTKVFAFNPEKPEVRQNIMFVSRKSDMAITINPNKKVVDITRPLIIKDMEIEEDTFLLDEELTLTDDKAPVEYLMLKQS